MLVVVLPEGLGGVLASVALEDLLTAGMLAQEFYVSVSKAPSTSYGHSLKSNQARSMRLLTCHVVDFVLDDEPVAARVGLMRCHVGGCEGLGHID